MMPALPSRAPLLLIAAGTALIAAGVLLPGGLGPIAEAGSAQTIYVNNNVFCATPGSSCSQPYNIQISPGETVNWLDGEAGGLHSVTECTGDGTGCPAPGGFDSGISTDPAGGYLSEAFPDAGTYYFFCTVHGTSMRGIITVGSPATPTPSPTPSPTPTPASSPTATPTPTAAVTATPTATTAPTGTATATATASPTPAPSGPSRADLNCDGVVDGDDVLALLNFSAENKAAPAGGACPQIGSDEGNHTKGDLNCDGEIDGRDALLALYVWAGLPVAGFLPEGCPGP
jgi:plastocyanin